MTPTERVRLLDADDKKDVLQQLYEAALIKFIIDHGPVDWAFFMLYICSVGHLKESSCIKPYIQNI